MTKPLILTPNKNVQCGMFQLAKGLATEMNGEVWFKGQKIPLNKLCEFKQVVTFMYPMHKHGKRLKDIFGWKWIVYNQGIPPVTKTYFPNFFRRQAMRYINWRNNITMQGADEYWDVTEREQKPRWTDKSHTKVIKGKEYALYIGRRTDYKNFDCLQKIMQELRIPFRFSDNWSDELTHQYLSNAKMLATASIWEGYGRTPQEAEALGIPAVAYDVGAHKRHINKGICVPLDINNMKKSEEAFKKAVLEVWNR